MNDLERVLARIPLAAAPAEWRGEILRGARNGAPETVSASWWQPWIRPRRLAFAAAWTAIAILRLSTPEEERSASPATLGQLRGRVATQLTLLAELFDPPAPPGPSPAMHEARVARRETHIA
jgi:hypothetical protein